VGAEIHSTRIWMVVSYELDMVGTLCVFLASSVLISVVPISFLRDAICLVTYWVTVLSSDGREAVHFRRTWVRPIFVKALSSQPLSVSHMSTGSLISLMSGRS
jgi:hypothetical protein